MLIKLSTLLKIAGVLERTGRGAYAAAGIVEIGKRGWLMWLGTIVAVLALSYALCVGADPSVALFSCFASAIQHTVLRLKPVARFLARLVDRLARFFTPRFFTLPVLRLGLPSAFFLSHQLVPAAPPPRACSRR